MVLFCAAFNNYYHYYTNEKKIEALCILIGVMPIGILSLLWNLSLKSADILTVAVRVVIILNSQFNIIYQTFPWQC